tara:strand:- start:50 stop:364 length:315 start_codon:yes stop_codon:yes gene_type:complete
MTDIVIIETTFDDKAEAIKCRNYLITKKLAACVQMLGPIESTYEWEGQIATEEEWCLRIKTKAEKFDKVEKTIQDLHSYDVPEIIAYPLEYVSDGYSKWLGSVV